MILYTFIFTIHTLKKDQKKLENKFEENQLVIIQDM